MQDKVFWILCAVTAFILVKAATFLQTKIRHAKLARALGCEPIPIANPRDVLGISSVRQLMKASGDLLLPHFLVERMAAVSERQGRNITTMQFRLLGQRIIFTSEPTNIQAVLAKQFKNFELGRKRTNNFHPLLGNGIFASDGKKWEHSRALLRPQFTRDQVSDLGLEETHVQNLMRALPINAVDGWTEIVDIQQLFFRLTIDSATEFLFGESVDSQLAALPAYAANKSLPVECDERVFAYAFDKAQWYLSRAFRLGNYYWLGHTPDFKKQCKSVHAFIDHFVQLALNKDVSKGDKEKADLTVDGKKEKYVLLEALALQTRDPIELRNELLNILLAGRDTTASLLSWLFLILAEHPSTYVKLRRSILDAFGSYAAPKEITYASLKDCAYLQCTINEVLRLFPVVPINSRRAAVDTYLPLGGGPDGQSPVFVPKGTDVEYSVYVMHRRKDLWGEDADDFRPERWQGKKIGWDYVPFNGGPRICIGQQFALTEASYVVVRLLQRFEMVESVGTSKPIKHGLTLTDCPAEGVHIRLREVKE